MAHQKQIVALASSARSLSVAAPTILTPSMSSTVSQPEHLLARLARVDRDALGHRGVHHLASAREAAELDLLERARLQHREPHAEVVEHRVLVHRLGRTREHERRVLPLGSVARLHVQDHLVVFHGLSSGRVRASARAARVERGYAPRRIRKRL